MPEEPKPAAGRSYQMGNVGNDARVAQGENISWVEIGILFNGPAQIGTLNYGIDAETKAKVDALMAVLSERADRRRLAVPWIIYIMAAVFVDEMRMLYVGVSAAARHANVERYSEFVAIARQHLDDFDKEFTRYIGELDPKFIRDVRHIQQCQLGTFRRLESGPCSPDYGTRYFKEVHGTAAKIHALYTSVQITAYESTSKMIAEISEQVWRLAGEPRGIASIDALFIARLDIQSSFLSRIQEEESSPILTIADDVHQRFALAYFIVDQWLMQHIAEDRPSGINYGQFRR